MTRYLESRTSTGVIQIDDNDFCTQQESVVNLGGYYKATENPLTRYYGQSSQTAQSVYVYGVPKSSSGTIYSLHNPSSTAVNVWFSDGYPYHYSNHSYVFNENSHTDYNLFFVNSPNKDVADALQLIYYRKKNSSYSLSYGLEIFDENGNKIYNTGDRPFRILKAGSYIPKKVQGYNRGYTANDFWSENSSVTVSSDRLICVWFGRMSGLSAFNNSGDLNHNQGEAVGCRLTNKSVIVSPNITSAMRQDAGGDRFPWCVNINNGAKYNSDSSEYYKIPYYVNYR